MIREHGVFIQFLQDYSFTEGVVLLLRLWLNKSWLGLNLMPNFWFDMTLLISFFSGSAAHKERNYSKSKANTVYLNDEILIPHNRNTSSPENSTHTSSEVSFIFRMATQHRHPGVHITESYAGLISQQLAWRSSDASIGLLLASIRWCCSQITGLREDRW